MRWFRIPLTAGLMSMAVLAEAPGQTPTASGPVPPPLPAPTYTINLGTRQACVTPHTQKLARAEGGFIDVTTPAPNNMTVSMTGTTAANSYLGCTGSATETFQLIQEVEVTCSDPSVRTASLTLDTALVGFVRSKGRAGAAVRRADVSLTPDGWDGTPLALAYPPLVVEGTHGRLCNQHLPPLQQPSLPLGRYHLVATLVLETRASGVCDAHAVADFSPDTTLPPDWVRTRDPFQGVSKKSFGFSIQLAVAPPTSPATLTGEIAPRPVPREGRSPAANALPHGTARQISLADPPGLRR